jgi:hypothetical protein
MRRDPRAYLWDVREAADAIASFIQGRSFEDYAGDLMLRCWRPDVAFGSGATAGDNW